MFANAGTGPSSVFAVQAIVAVFVRDAGGTGRLDTRFIRHELDMGVAQRLAVELGGSLDDVVENEGFATAADCQ
jgi:hypothetical protein